MAVTRRPPGVPCSPGDLDSHAQDRITGKLDETVNSEWRDPDDHLEPLTGAPHPKLRVGQFRLGADCNHERQAPDVYTIERREGAYEPGDD